LQDDYQVTLYYKKKTGGIELTNEGRLFLARAQKIAREIDALKSRFSRTSQKPAQILAVGGTFGVSAVLLPRLVGVFRKTHPRVRVIMRASSSAKIQKELLHGDVEVGLMARRPTSRHIEVEPYRTHSLVAFVHASHPYAHRRAVSLAEVAATPLVLRGHLRSRSTAETILRKQGYKPNVAIRCETPEAVRMAVRNNPGIGILFYDSVERALRSGEFKALTIPGLTMEASSYIVYHKERPLSANAKDFLALLRKEKEEGEDLGKTSLPRGGATAIGTMKL
jgi:DNA-binding transcriptional LysR family regulator